MRVTGRSGRLYIGSEMILVLMEPHWVVVNHSLLAVSIVMGSILYMEMNKDRFLR